MFLGHYAVGFAAKKVAPKTSLGFLFAAAIWLDLIWPVFVMFGLEHFNVAPNIMKMSSFQFTDYPLSHSLVMAVAWGLLWGLVALILKQDLKVAGLLAGLVVSHWVLDLFVHSPDLPLLPAESLSGIQHKYGLGLWNSMPGTLVLEFGLFLAGCYLYLKSTKAKDENGSIGLWALWAFLIIVYAASFLQIPPDNVNLIAFVSQFQWLVVFWGYWVDQHRKNV